MFTRGVLERNETGKFGRKMQARQCQNTVERSRQERRPSVHAVKHCSTSRTNTDVSVRSAEKCTLSVERSKEAQLCSSGSVRELNVCWAHNLSCTQGGTEAQEPAARPTHTCTLSPADLLHSSRRDPLRDKIREVGRGLSLADTQTGRYGRLYSRRRLRARRGADALGRRSSDPFLDFQQLLRLLLSGQCVPKTYRYRYFANTV